MSDDLLKEISRLNAENAQLRAEAKKHRIRRKGTSEELNMLKSEHEQLFKEREEYKAKLESNPSDVQAELDKLKGEIRARDHKAKFAELAAKAKVRPDALEAAYHLSKYTPEGEVDEAAIAKAIQETVASNVFLVQDSTQEAAPAPAKLEAGPGYQRGAATPSGFVVTAANLSDPRWMYDNQSKMVEAQKNGTIILAD